MRRRSFFQLVQGALNRLPMRLMTIRTRVIISYLVIVGAGFLYLVKQISDDSHPSSLEAAEETMVDMSHAMASFAGQSFSGDQLDTTRLRQAFDAVRERKFSARIYAVEKTQFDLRVYATDASGRVVFDSDGGKAEGQDYSQKKDVFRTLRGQYGARATLADKEGRAWIFVAAPILRDGKIVGVLSVSKPASTLAAFINRTRKQIALLGGAIVCGVILLGTLFSAWLTYPIRNLIKYARAIRDGRRTPRPNLGHSEIRALGIAFEEMRDALEGKDYVKRYVQTLTHEMKSPVAAIQGAAELLHEEMPPEERRKFLGNIQTETARIQEVVDSLLLLSSVESKKSLESPEPLDLCQLAHGAMERIAARAEVKGIAISEELPGESAMICGDLFLLERALLNLLENAVAFTPAGGAIAVRLHRKTDRWELAVEDSGPGIPDYALARVFERFYSLSRPDTGKKSSGLGLAFVREVALLHGGEATLGNRAKGGARAVLRLPG